MDIGDPSEIPATRRKLPSMQELGAFDVEAPPAPVQRPDSLLPPAARPATRTAGAPRGHGQAAEPITAPAPLGGPADNLAAPGRPALTAEQLRQALAKADPGTRQKLLRLIAGGRNVQQVGAGGAGDAERRRSLVMPVGEPSRRAPAAAPAAAAGFASAPSSAPSAPRPRAETSAPASDFGAFTAQREPGAGRAAPPRPAAAARDPRRAEPALMKIDEHTELLDAAPAVHPAARKAELQAQLDQMARPAAAPAEPLAHKVLFPAYDPARHGEDVHGPGRRRQEGPIEGHYPAPRQPFKPTYQHPDGRPMTPEENRVEEALQTQRCEETLGVLARDGVNGLLLSPRDLDAAVAAGVITAEAAATLWTTWAALRPVIHVIEDDPPPAGAAPTEEAAPEAEPHTAAATDPPDRPATDTNPPAESIMPGEPGEPADRQSADEPVPGLAPAAAVLPVDRVPPAPSPPVAASIAPSPSPMTPAVQHAIPAHPPSPKLAEGLAPAAAEDEAAPRPDISAGPRGRLRAGLRTLAWVFIAYCVLVTSSRLALAAWLQWGHWLTR